jgi:hypothetical protein
MAENPEFAHHPNRIVGWTVRELDDKFESLDNFLEERDRRYEERFRSMDERDRRYDERDRRYDDRFHAQETAVSAALAASEKLVNAAFAASKEAILKAEESQKGVNERGNEFRGQLADQANTLMPRKETEAAITNLNERIERGQSTAVSALEELKRESRVENDKLRQEIRSLSESRSQGLGQTETIRGVVFAAIAIGGIVVGMLTSGYFRSAPPPAIVTPAAPPVIIVQPPVAPTGGTMTDSKTTTTTRTP